MLRHRAYIKLCHALTLTSLTLFASSAFAQSPAVRQDSQQKEVVTPRPGNKIIADEPRPTDLQTEIVNLKAENVAVRELLRKMEEQQKTLLEQVDRLQRRLDGTATAEVQAKVADETVPLTNSTNARLFPRRLRPVLLKSRRVGITTMESLSGKRLTTRVYLSN